MKQVVCKKEELRPGEIKSSVFGKTPIVVCRTLKGEFYAFADRCIHQGAPLSRGGLCGTTLPKDKPGEYAYEKEGAVLRCPWHGREFDVEDSGRMLAKPESKLREFPVELEGDDVVVGQ